MATDATGPVTTNYSFPTFNTSADAPSGLGNNAQIAAVDTALKTVENKIGTKPGLGLLIALGG